MARPFTTREAKAILKQYQNLQQLYSEVSVLQQLYGERVVQAADQYRTEKVLEILKDVPVEEINRGEPRIRVKVLRDNCFMNIADLERISAAKLSSLRGISEETAKTIKSITAKLAEEVKSNTRIRLSLDDKSPAAAALLYEIAYYRELKPIIGRCVMLYEQDHKEIQSKMETLKASTNVLKWIFQSKEKKNIAEKSFKYLSECFGGVYGKEIKDVQRLLEAFRKTKICDYRERFGLYSVEFISILEELVPGVLGNDDAVYGLPEELASEIQKEDFSTQGLLCTLRRYQEWGVKYILHQKRVLLGDEMGLGKTIQAIAVMVSLKNAGASHFLVICPASVITNWCREIEKKSVLQVIKIHGKDRNDAFHEWLKSGGVAVTTYETTGFLNFDQGFSYSMCIVDEAHYIKNPGAKRTSNVKRICAKAERILFMTGTALENRVDEMIELIEILQPSVAQMVEKMAFMAAAPQFREAVAPVYYRRKREDVLAELPELIESKEWCVLSEQEQLAYEASVFSKNYADVRRVSWNVDDLTYSSKANRLLEIIDEAAEDGRKVIVFSFFLDTIRKVCLLLGDKCLEPINGSVPPQRRQEIIDEFEKAPSGTVLAAQIISGGTGLNIQSASVVIICEPQFKPSTENQAISRAYRMGQTRNVLVYRLLCDDTVDERITDLLAEKQMVFDAFADQSAAAEHTENVEEAETIEIDSASFGKIVQAEMERINTKKRNDNKADTLS